MGEDHSRKESLVWGLKGHSGAEGCVGATQWKNGGESSILTTSLLAGEECSLISSSVSGACVWFVTNVNHSCFHIVEITVVTRPIAGSC